MTNKKISAGDIRPIYQIVGFEVCKDSDKEEWVQTEKKAEAEILSYIFKLK